MTFFVVVFFVLFPSWVPLPPVGRVPLLRRPNCTLCFPRAALYGCGHLQWAPHISYLPHYQVGKGERGGTNASLHSVRESDIKQDRRTMKVSLFSCVSDSNTRKYVRQKAYRQLCVFLHVFFNHSQRHLPIRVGITRAEHVRWKAEFTRLLHRGNE